VPDGHAGVWALGVSFQQQATQRLWHFTGGRWTGPQRPAFGGTAGELLQLAAVPGTGSVWGAGIVAHGDKLDGLIAIDGPTPR
jgi:hypothetical protein